MSLATLRLLFWKDLRQHRLVLVGVLMLLLMPFVLTAIQAMRSEEPVGALDTLSAGAFIAMFLGVLSSAIVGGASFASERADGSADVLQLLLPRRGVVLTGRILFAAAAIAIALGVPTAVWIATTGRVEGMSPEDVRRSILLAGGFTLAAFGVAWAWSSVRRSPAIGAALGIGAAITIAFLVPQATPGVADLPDGSMLHRVTVIESIVGAVAFALGCGLYLRRTEP